MLRLLIRKTAWEMDHIDRAGVEPLSDKVSMCNYWANRLCCEAADRAMQVHGGIGYSRHKPFEHIYRHHRRYRITEGSEEIQMRKVAAICSATWARARRLSRRWDFRDQDSKRSYSEGLVGDEAETANVVSANSSRRVATPRQTAAPADRRLRSLSRVGVKLGLFAILGEHIGFTLWNWDVINRDNPRKPITVTRPSSPLDVER